MGEKNDVSVQSQKPCGGWHAKSARYTARVKEIYSVPVGFAGSVSMTKQNDIASLLLGNAV